MLNKSQKGWHTERLPFPLSSPAKQFPQTTYLPLGAITYTARCPINARHSSLPRVKYTAF